MSIIKKAIMKYLQGRRAFGYKLDYSERLLLQFADYLEKHKATVITQELAIRWACLPDKCRPPYWAKRLCTVRLFARYYSSMDPRTEVPTQELLPFRNKRTTPYIYTERQMLMLIKAAKKLPSKTGLRASTLATIFGLLIVTGMRIGEIVGLDREDVNLNEGVLLVKKAKLGRRRLVPIHPSTVKALQDYELFRNKVYPNPQTAGFFVSEAGIRATADTVRRNFYKLSYQTGIRQPSSKPCPRIHDFRHTFAVNMVLNWYQQDRNVEKLLPQLATYLGHQRLNNTYWYMTATPELLKLAAERTAERIN